MNIRDFLRLVGQPGRSNYFIVCSDDLGIPLLLQGALSPIAATDDVYYYDAEQITKEKARQIEAEARMAPRGGSALSHFYIYSLQKLPTDSVGPLLKATEEAKYSRFIFQAQAVPPKVHTLMSRSSVVRLPFLSKKAVLGNMKALNHDARTADQLNLYDGTLGGTIRALGMKDTMTEIKREIPRGMRGVAALFDKNVLTSLAFEPATDSLLSPAERSFVRVGGGTEGVMSLARKRIALYKALGRQS